MKDSYINWAATYWLTPIRYKKIIEKYWDLEKAWKNISRNFLTKIWESEKFINILFDKKKEISLEKEKILLEKYWVDILFFKDEKYPKKLKEIPDFPIFLYIQWELKKEDEVSLSIVWSRNVSTYWKQVLRNIVPDLSKKLTIISWLAKWIDWISHEITIENRGRTIAVVWTWLDKVYPFENTKLAEKIRNGNWAIISEFPFWTSPERFNFPRRNRIVAWMSLWTLLVEARERSGSLITGQLALDYNREIFAIPWNIFSQNSIWTNTFIKKWMAKLILSAEDIFEELNIEQRLESNKISKEIQFKWSENEEKIMNVLDKIWKDLTKISEETGLWISEISSKLTLLELQWYSLNLWMNIWVKN